MRQSPLNPEPETPRANREKPEAEGPEPVWTYRGYRIKPGEFTTAMVHFFRAELQRSNVWRQRLDITTNWAVVATGAVITFAFSDVQGHHALILLSFLLVALFLSMEARRYRYYELWSYRVRLMETEFFSSMLVSPFSPDPEWAANLSETLRRPQFTITILEAVGRRLRRNYLAIFAVLLLSWFGKLWLHPTSAGSVEDVIRRASLGVISGEMVWAGMVLFWVLVLGVSFLTIGLHESSGEVLTQDTLHTGHSLRYVRVRESAGQHGPGPAAGKARPVADWLRMGRPKPQAMALIITDRPDEVAQIILAELKRGITSITGKGMYSGNAHHVLLCALRAEEAGRLKLLTSQKDPNAFVIILAANEVLGKGFVPLTDAPS